MPCLTAGRSCNTRAMHMDMKYSEVPYTALQPPSSKRPAACSKRAPEELRPTQGLRLIHCCPIAISGQTHCDYQNRPGSGSNNENLEFDKSEASISSLPFSISPRKRTDVPRASFTPSQVHSNLVSRPSACPLCTAACYILQYG